MSGPLGNQLVLFFLSGKQNCVPRDLTLRVYCSVTLLKKYAHLLHIKTRTRCDLTKTRLGFYIFELTRRFLAFTL